jgi:hypothetical protein
VSIGINLPIYPEFERIPGYPVYYAPRLNSNFFFYDGLYWVFQGDDWYASSWYNGPWDRVGPRYVPLYILRVPVRYYRQPPAYFHGWQRNSPPRWGDHWGNDWSRDRRGWDHWNRKSTPAAAPLPRYQRNYSGDRYPDADRQRTLQQHNYLYRPRDPEVRRQYEAQRGHPPADASRRDRQDESQGRRPEARGKERTSAPPSDQHRTTSTQREEPSQSQQRGSERGGGNAQRDAPSQAPSHMAGPSAAEQRAQRPDHEPVRQQQSPPNSGREGAAPEHERGQPGQARGHGRDKDDEGDDRSQGRGR